ncbi:MAG: fused MFS/spermidine synthase [Acidobacteriia bacterium]|nr:fused MFS/spermidine synthase [Terriglobia bacterium]
MEAAGESIVVEERGGVASPMSRVWAHRLVYACFFLSGATGLIYEILWMRLLGLVFGNSVYAITTAVCAFMSGLALGGYFWGRWVDRRSYPLLGYAALEVVVGLTALAVPTGLKIFQAVYFHFYPSISHSLWVLNAIRFVSAFTVLLVPTFFMGGTLPVLSRFFVRSRSEISQRLGGLYGLNTLGATLGTLVAGFYFVSHVPVRVSLWLTVALNLLIGWVALGIHKRITSIEDQGASEESAGDPVPVMALEPTENGEDSSSHPRRVRVLLAAFLVSGFVSLLYEIAWTRELTLVIGSSVYAFALILSVYLSGIALGSLLFSRIFEKRRIDVALFGWVELLIGAGAFLTVPLYLKSFSMLLMLRRAFSENFGAVIFAQLFVCFVLLLLPTLLFGSTLPLVAKLATRRVSGLGRSIGLLYSANTVGCIFGSFLTGFILLSWLTARRTILLGVILNVLVGGVLLLEDSWKRHRRTLAAAGLFGLFLIFVLAGNFFYNPRLQDAGVFIYADQFNKQRALPLERQLQTEDLAFYREGLNANISVHTAENYAGLRTNGKTDASNAGDMSTQLLLGYLPALLHPHPQNALIIGLGSGSTASSVAQISSIRSLQVVEIEPAVLEAAPFFDSINRRVYQDPRFHVVVDDARNYLLNTRDRFDLIISEPSNPWIAGIGNLYTAEFYEEAVARLNPDGIMCQWVQIYQLDPESLRMILRTFGESFPWMSMWRTTSGDVLLLGARKPVPLDVTHLESQVDRIPTLQNDLKTYLKIDETPGLLTYFLLPDWELRHLAQKAERNTDDLPLLEFRAPQAMFQMTEALNANLLEELRRTWIPPAAVHFNSPHDLLPMAETFLNRQMPEAAAQLLGLWEKANRSATSEAEFPTAATRDGARFLLASARLAGAQMNYPEAERRFREAHQAAPDDATIAEEYGVFLNQRRRLSEALPFLKLAFTSRPESNRALFYLFQTEDDMGQKAEAIRDGLQYVNRPLPRDKQYQGNAVLGIVYAHQGDARSAEIWFLQALQVDRYSYVAHRQLADLFLKQHRWQEAIRECEFLVRYFPTREDAIFVELSKLYEESSRQKEARDLIRLGRRLFPNSTSVYHQWVTLCGPNAS